MPSGVSTTGQVWRRRLLFALLYFSEGAPIGYIWWAMPTRLRASGMPVDQVAALTALLTLPWALKFLWAPAVDAFRGRRFGYRMWITVAQLAMGITLLPLAALPAESIIGFVKWLLIAHAFAATTQDVAIDALAISTVPHDERGKLTGWMQAGMLLGRGIFGGLALVAEKWLTAQGVVAVLIGCIWVTLLVVWLSPSLVGKPPAARDAMRGFTSSIRRVILKRSTWIGMGIALTAGAGFEAVGGLAGSFLLDEGASKERIGWFLAIPAISAMIIGSLVGGWAADRYGHRRMLVSAVIAIACCIGLLVASRAISDERAIMQMTVLLPIYVWLGVLTASSYALFMDLSDPAIGGTQFSAFMGATNLCEVWAVALAGWIVRREGYSMAFGALALLSFVSIVYVVGLGKLGKAGRLQSAKSETDLPDEVDA